MLLLPCCLPALPRRLLSAVVRHVCPTMLLALRPLYGFRLLGGGGRQLSGHTPLVRSRKEGLSASRMTQKLGTLVLPGCRRAARRGLTVLPAALADISLFSANKALEAQ